MMKAKRFTAYTCAPKRTHTLCPNCQCAQVVLAADAEAEIAALEAERDGWREWFSTEAAAKYDLLEKAAAKYARLEKAFLENPTHTQSRCRMLEKEVERLRKR